jgi:hypothetical protein
MKKQYILVGGALIIILIGGFFLFNTRAEAPEPIQNEEVIEEEVEVEVVAEPLPGIEQEEVSQNTLYFAAQLTKPATPDGPIPIEGYDPWLLLGRYPNMNTLDFAGVEAMQGFYSIENGKHIFNFTADYEHSAARTISPEGYETLLANISSRLKLPANTDADINIIIAMLK